MADWLIFLFKIGGFGAVLVFALFLMGKWLLKQIIAALNSYVTAYAQETAKIDARIERLEKLAEEQARLTRTVETIKDEIAAQAKSRDNRWAFRKEVYVNLITASHDLLKTLHNLNYAVKLKEDPNEALRKRSKNTVEATMPELRASIKALTTYTTLAPLATADDVLPLLERVQQQVLQELDPDATDAATRIQAEMKALFTLLKDLQAAGRKDLWGTLEPRANV